MWKFTNMPLNNPCIQKEITVKIRKYFGLQEMNENVMYIKVGGDFLILKCWALSIDFLLQKS